MKRVAKLIILAENDNYLLLTRNDHPVFGNDTDLPGGTAKDRELPIMTMLREVKEETKLNLETQDFLNIYKGMDYSANGTEYSLFITKLSKRPEIILSWEHSSYQWVSKKEFLIHARNSKDSFMQMVYESLNNET